MLVHADRARLVTAVVNLLHNAIKFSGEGTEVRVALAANSFTATVSVSDDGIGIAPQDQPILFTRFGRVHRDAAVARIPGAGLGLYLSREIANAHGGDVSVVSEPGSGSTFTLSLPLFTG